MRQAIALILPYHSPRLYIRHEFPVRLAWNAEYTSQRPAATAAALPPELPPAEIRIRSSFRMEGFMTGPKILCVECEPIPNSSMFVLPKIKLPSLFRASTQSALQVGLKSRVSTHTHHYNQWSYCAACLMHKWLHVQPHGCYPSLPR